MIKLHYLRNFLKKLTPLLFIISIFSHLSVSTIIDDLFTRSDNSYILRLKLNFVVPGVRTVCNDQNSIQCYTPFIWNIIHKRFLNFRHVQKPNPKMEAHNWPCRLWKKYLPNLDIINQI